MSALSAPSADGELAPGISSLVTLFGAVRHDERGFVNAADLARASGTTTQAYLKNEKNTLFVKTLAGSLECSISDLMVSGHGGAGAHDPTCHPEVAVDLARWSNPVLGVELGLVLSQFFSGRLRTEHSVAANKVSECVLLLYIIGTEYRCPSPACYLYSSANDGWNRLQTLPRPSATN